MCLKAVGLTKKYEPIAWCPRQFTFWISDPLKTNTSVNMIFCIPTDQEKKTHHSHVLAMNENHIPTFWPVNKNDNFHTSLSPIKITSFSKPKYTTITRSYHQQNTYLLPFDLLTQISLPSTKITFFTFWPINKKRKEIAYKKTKNCISLHSIFHQRKNVPPQKTFFKEGPLFRGSEKWTPLQKSFFEGVHFFVVRKSGPAPKKRFFFCNNFYSRCVYLMGLKWF